MSRARHLLLLREGRQGEPAPSNGIDDVLELRRHAAARRSTAPSCPSSCSPPASSCWSASGPDLMYLSTTDYVQHKHAPGTPTANAFYAMMDRYLGELDALGAVLALTADHGMNDKHRRRRRAQRDLPAGLCSTSWLGAGQARVILPITDPYVVHHGALGSFATVYLPEEADRARRCSRRCGRSRAWSSRSTRAEACARFELPPDRIGDVVVDLRAPQGARHQPRRGTICPGSTEPLRSHGGVSEQRVPLIVNRAVDGPGRPRRCATSTSSTSRSISVAEGIDHERTAATRRVRPPRGDAHRRRKRRRPTTSLEVRNPYTDAVVGTVPAARPRARRAQAFARRPAPSSRS